MTIKTRDITNLVERINWNMTNHTPEPEQVAGIEYLRKRFIALAEAVAVECPHSRERSEAITLLETALMWAVASIARAEVVE